MAAVDATLNDYKTYRVLGVDKTWDVEKLRVCLASQPGDIQPKVLSLATETDKRSQTATVVFQNGRVPTSPIQPENILIEDTFHGITPLFTPSKENHKVDIIAISGLGGHAFGSFKQRGSDHMWLRDSLPHDLVEEGDDERDRPIARIMIYGYASGLDDRSTFQSMEDIASSFRQAVEDCRLTKPTIFIGHSLGGILVKEAFNYWTQSKQHTKLLQAVHAIVFFATPHDGMEITSLIPMVGETNRSLIDLLNRHNPTKLSSQREQFLRALKTRPETEIFSFYETQLSPTARKDEKNNGKWKIDGPLAVLVSQPSATIYRPGEDGPIPTAAINRSHSEIVKFRPHDPAYKSVRGTLLRVCNRAIEKQKVPAVQTSEKVLKRRESLMEALKFTQLDERLSTIKPAYKRTYEWVLNHPTFRQWQKSTDIPDKHRMIWIKGVPGAGKSTIMKFAYNRIRKRTGETVLAASFFFNARGDELERTVWGMYRSLLWQLLDHFTDLQMVFDNSELLGPYRDTCSLVELQNLLRGAVLQLGQRSLFWFIDALDECKEAEVAEMLHYFEELNAYTLENGINLAMCFSSRHYPAIRIRRSVELILDCDIHHNNDLRIYITDRLHVDDNDLVEKVLKKASGVFLWAVLVVEILNKEDLDGGFAMNKRLEKVPGDLRNLFIRLLGQKTGNTVKDEATKLSMLWLLFARQSLHPIQYCNAIWAGLLAKGLLEVEDIHWDETTPNAHDRARQYVVSSSRGLAQVTGTTILHVQLIHESIRDFLLKEDGLAQLWPDLRSHIEGLSHATLQQSCIKYWSYISNSAPRNEIARSSSASSSAPALVFWDNSIEFADYVIDCVLGHAEAAASAVSQDKFLSTFPIASNNETQEASGANYISHGQDTLYVLSYGGYAKLISTFLRLEEATDRTARRTGRHRFPTIAAAANHHQSAFEVLCSSSKDIYVGADLFEGLRPFEDEQWRAYGEDGPTYDRYTPLSWAATRGYTEMVRKLLFQYGEAVNEQNRRGLSPLNAAARFGHEATTKLLLEGGADINRAYPLVEASAGGSEEIIRLLIKKGADVNAGKPLVEALKWGHEEVAWLLIENGADIHRGNPLAEASEQGFEAIARMLIERGADLNAQYPLVRAVRGGWKERLVRLMAKAGIPLNGGSPLHESLMSGRQRMVRLLIEKGADVDAGGPLAEAFIWGSKEIAQILLEAGADINAGDPLVSASHTGDKEAVQSLIDNEANVNGGAPLVRAITKGREEIAELLLTHGADPTLPDKYGVTPVQAALRSHTARSYDIIKLLAACDTVEPGDYITLAAQFGETSKLQAVIEGFEARQNLAADEAIHAPDALGRTGIAHASRQGDIDTIQLLLEYGKANISKADRYGNTPLDVAVRNCHGDIIQVLLSAGARLSDTNNLANTSLLGWARLRREDNDENDIVRLLKSHASLTGGYLRDDPAPSGYERDQFHALEAWCDVCTLPIDAKASYYVCEACDKMGLTICHVCWAQGNRCLNVQHMLGDKIVEATAE